MSILHLIARSMLASYFVVNGVKALRRSGQPSDEAIRWADSVMPVVKALLPGSAGDRLPSDAVEFARLHGTLQVVGGLSLATGLGRRLGATVLAATMVPQLVAENPLGGPKEDRPARLAATSANVALMGGTLLAAQDTQGKPSLAWRAQTRREALASQRAAEKKAAKKAAERKAAEKKATEKAKRATA